MTSSDSGSETGADSAPAQLVVLDGSWFGGWLALGIILVLLLAGHRPAELLPSPDRLLGVVIWPVVAAFFAITRRPAIVVAYAIGLGFLLRAAVFYPGGGSDTLLAVTEWFATLQSGADPYGHFYTTTIPPGTVVAYPPFQFLIHLPGYLLGGYDGVRFTEVASAMGILVTLAWLGRKWGWMAALPAIGIYAALPNLVNLSTDGGNDTSSGAVLLAAVVTASWAEHQNFGMTPTRIAGVVGGLALATKQTELFVVIVLMAWVWRRASFGGLRNYGAGVLLVLIGVSIPFLVLDAVSYLQAMIGFATILHVDIFGWNMWTFAIQLGLPVPSLAQASLVSLVIVAVATIAALRVPYDLYSTAVIGGVLLTLVALLTNPWTSYSYFALIAPLIVAIPLLIEIEGWPRIPPMRLAIASTGAARVLGPPIEVGSGHAPYIHHDSEADGEPSPASDPPSEATNGQEE